MQDPTILEHINALATEEERLYERAGDGTGLSADEIARLETIKVELDQYYDLLHQRAGRRAAGLDPDEATVRPPTTVERYEQ